MDALTEQLNAQHEHFAADMLHKIPGLKVARDGGAGGSPELKPGQKLGKNDKGIDVVLTEYTADELLLEISKGQRYYKVRSTSGRWQKYGCNIWDEQVKAYGIAELLGSQTTMKLQGVKMWCEDREKGGAVREIVGLP
jgi:hypothetical protein